MKQFENLSILLIAIFVIPTLLICLGCSPAKPSNKILKELINSEIQDGHEPGLLCILYKRSNHQWANFADSNLGWGITKDPSFYSELSLADRNQILIDEKSIEVKSIEIKQWGIFNQEKKYWPCKIRTKGSAIVTGRGLKPERKEFDAVVDYRFDKDDYGKWEVRWVL